MTEQEIADELDRIYDFDDMIGVEETWDYINEVLDEIDVQVLDPTFIIAYIHVTFPIDRHLPARKPLIAAFHHKYPQYRHIS